MIPKVAVDNYLGKHRDDHRWLKGLGHKELDSIIAEMVPRPQLFPQMHLHQKVGFILGVAYPQFAYWMDMGSGKTLIVLELMKYWRQCAKLRRGIIFVTSDKAFSTWEKQVERFETGLSITALEGSSKDKWRQLEQAVDGLVLITYPGAVPMVVDRKDKTRAGRSRMDNDRVDEMAYLTDAFVMDESTRAGHQSLTHQLMLKLSERIDCRYGLAGRPFGRDPTMLWAQMRVIDGGESLGPTLGLFREAFFIATHNERARSKYAMDYTFRKRMQPQLSRMLQHRSITYTEDEMPDLPKLQRIIEEVRLPAEAVAYVERLVAKAKENRGNMQEMQNVFLRLRQLSSGFVGLKDSETGERAQIEFEHNPKRELLFEILEDLPEGRKAVVFYDFTYSGRNIVKGLKDLGFDPIWLWSGTEDSRAEKERFLSESGCRVAVINNRVGAYSLDGLQEVANYTFFYESPVSVIDREQAEKRVRRQGQTRHVFQYDLIVRDTVDKKILEFHKEGKDLFKTLLRDPAKIFG